MTFGTDIRDKREREKAAAEDEEMIILPKEHWEEPEPEFKSVIGYNLCDPDQFYVQHDNLEAYGIWVILSAKWRHRGGYSNEKGVPLADVHAYLSVTYYKNKQKKKIKKLLDDILLIETGALQAENQQLAERSKES